MSLENTANVLVNVLCTVSELVESAGPPVRCLVQTLAPLITSCMIPGTSILLILIFLMCKMEYS